MGQIRLRGSVYWVRYYRDGRRYEESTRSAVKDDAKKLLRLRESQSDQGIPVTPAINRLRFEQAAADLLTEYRTNDRRSIDSLSQRIEHGLRPFFKARRMAHLTTTDVRTYIDTRQEVGASNATINRELSALKRMFTLAVQAGRLVHRAHIPLLQEHNVRQGFFEREAFDSLRAHLPAALRPLVTIAYYTGWRIQSELLPLEWRQVDLKAETIRLEPGTTKSREARLFVFKGITELCDTFKALAAQRDRLRAKGLISPKVFLRFVGSPKRHTERVAAIRHFRRAWLTACKAAGCPGRIPHDFRRTAVRNLVRAGVPERVAMQITGHKTRSVFERYNIVSEGDLTEAAVKLGASTGTISGTVRGTADVSGIRPKQTTA